MSTRPDLDLTRDPIARAETLDDLKASFRTALGPFGVTAHAAGHLVPADPSRGFLLLDWPVEWLQLYAAQGFAQEDVAVAEALHDSAPFSWGEIKDRRPGASLRIFSAAAGFGWHDGLVVPVHGPGEQRGIVSIAGAKLDLSPEPRRNLIRLCLAAFDRARRIDGQHCALSPADLTSREREVLGLVAQGRSDAEIAALLGISRSTAHFHVEGVKRRLGAKTRAHAVALALGGQGGSGGRVPRPVARLGHGRH